MVALYSQITSGSGVRAAGRQIVALRDHRGPATIAEDHRTLATRRSDAAAPRHLLRQAQPVAARPHPQRHDLEGAPLRSVTKPAAVQAMERSPPRGAVRYRQLVRLPGVPHVEPRLQVGPVHPLARDRIACGALEVAHATRQHRLCRLDDAEGAGEVADRLRRQNAPRRQQAGMARHEHAAHAEGARQVRGMQPAGATERHEGERRAGRARARR